MMVVVFSSIFVGRPGHDLIDAGVAMAWARWFQGRWPPARSAR